MKLDLIHDIQQVYRKVLNAMARPGVIEDISEASQKIDLAWGVYKGTLALMHMLLDTEVSYKMISKEEKAITQLVNQLTYAKATTTEEADYIFILEDASKDQIEEALAKAKIGSLIDPHISATVLMESPVITNEEKLLLKGPGIEKEHYLEVQISGDWVDWREKKNKEYPLGIDMIFVDSKSHIACLPRTTQILKTEVKSWDMLL